MLERKKSKIYSVIRFNVSITLLGGSTCGKSENNLFSKHRVDKVTVWSIITQAAAPAVSRSFQ